MSRKIEQLRRRVASNMSISPDQRPDRSQRYLMEEIEDHKKRKEARRKERRQEGELQEAIGARQTALDVVLGAKLELSRKFEQAGRFWRICLENNLDTNIRNIVRRELKNTMVEFNAKGENDRVSFLYQLANGLGLTEEDSGALGQEAASGVFFEYSLEPYHQTQSGRRLSTASGLLIEAVGDITLGRSEEQRTKFRNSIINSEDLRGLPSVSLSQTLPAIAACLVAQSGNIPQSSRPS